MTPTAAIQLLTARAPIRVQSHRAATELAAAIIKTPPTVPAAATPPA